MTRQTIIPVAHDDEFSLRQFLGDPNQILVHELEMLATGARHSPIIYFWGDAGRGKTHLLLGCCQFARAAGRRAHYLNLGSDTVIDQQPCGDGASGEGDLICVDAVQAIAGLPVREKQLFQLYEHCLTVNGSMALAGLLPLGSMTFTRQDLPSRLARGGTYALHPLTDSEKCTAIRMRAKVRGMHIPDEVMKYILSRYGRDEKTLFALLDKLDSESLKLHRKVTIPFLKSLD